MANQQEHVTSLLASYLARHRGDYKAAVRALHSKLLRPVEKWREAVLRTPLPPTPPKLRRNNRHHHRDRAVRSADGQQTSADGTDATTCLLNNQPSHQPSHTANGAAASPGDLTVSLASPNSAAEASQIRHAAANVQVQPATVVTQQGLMS
eukprot:6187994-Pleurochrysis_carterae.AAC.1